MNQVIKSFLGVFLILFLGASCIGVFSVFLQVIQAQDFESQVVREMEDSDFYPGVIRECFDSAENHGYLMKISLYADGASPIVVEKKADLPVDLSSIDSAEVEMKFKMQVPLFAISEEKTLVAHAG